MYELGIIKQYSILQKHKKIVAKKFKVTKSFQSMYLDCNSETSTKYTWYTHQVCFVTMFFLELKLCIQIKYIWPLVNIYMKMSNFICFFMNKNRWLIIDIMGIRKLCLKVVERLLKYWAVFKDSKAIFYAMNVCYCCFRLYKKGQLRL